MFYRKILPLFHRRWVFGRRVAVLANHVADLLPDSGTVLDVGCGDGRISKMVMDRKPGLEYCGVEVLERPDCVIPVSAFDGESLPFDTGSFDFVTFVDVLHHTEAPGKLLAEARRVARTGVVIKDHLCENAFARRRLTFMDKVGNISHGVALPFNYLCRHEWDALFERHQLRRDHWNERLGLYPAPARPMFENGLHFVGRFLT